VGNCDRVRPLRMSSFHPSLFTPNPSSPFSQQVFTAMRSSQKRKWSPEVSRSRPPPITPRTSEPRPGRALRASSRASTTSLQPPMPSSARQVRTPFQTETYPSQEESRRASSSDDDSGHIIAAIDMKDYGTVGCSYYSAEEEKMYLLGDTRSGGMETIEACAFLANPGSVGQVLTGIQ
jgi:DNA mismatch repair protein MSH5